MAVVATGAAGAFAVSALTGAARGGAATPEDLGLSLLTAIEDEDVLGVVDVLSPGEREVFRDPLVELVAELTRLGVLSDEADLARILGVDLDLENESVVATSTNVPDITNIDLSAEATIIFDGAELPVGELITDQLPDETMAVLRGARLTDTDELNLRLTAIEEDGRWYFSVFHSVAEAARGELTPSSLIPVQGIGADGAETPGAAFDNLLDRVEALDLTGILRSLNPGEAAALQRYSPLFLDDAESLLDEAPLRWEITRREYRVEESGEVASVFVDALAIEGTVEDESFSVEFVDGCVRAAAADRSIERCDDGTFDDTTDVFADAPEIERFIETVTEAFSDIEEIGLRMRRTDELWYVSPTTTSSEAFLAVLRALDRSELDAIVDQGAAAAEVVTEAILGGAPRLPGSFDDFVDPVVDVDGGPGVDDGTGERAGGQECYGELDPAMAEVCFATAVANGEIEASDVPLVLRHPECGYLDSWGGGVYDLPDDEFIAAAKAARPCFFELVARGEADEFELPPEISHLECFEGRNWYQVFDDSDYDERYYECVTDAFDG